MVPSTLEMYGQDASDALSAFFIPESTTQSGDSFSQLQLPIMNGKESRILTIFFLLFYCFASPVASWDTLQPGTKLNSSNHLVSANNIFTLGFFRPQRNSFWPQRNSFWPQRNSFRPQRNSYTIYLGIWYTNDFERRPVWVGNRETPIYNNSGILTIDSSGKLIITHSGGDPIELYAGGGQTGSNTTTATLSDSGNFIVRVVNSSTGSVEQVWESFDHPTDTLLPGMKLGFNHRTGRNWSLTSWFDDTRPAPGAFTLEWDPRGRQLIVRRRGVIYWTSGVLKHWGFEFIGTFSSYDFINVTRDDEEYFTYSMVDQTIISGWLLGYKGKIEDFAGTTIARADLCYGYNTRGSEGPQDEVGCELWEQPKCRNSSQTFDSTTMNLDNVDYQQIGNSSLSDCRDECWNDCNCIGFEIDADNYCLIWRGKEVTFGSYYSEYTSSTDRYILISETSNLPSDVPTYMSSNMGSKRLTWIVIAVVIVLLMLLSGVLCCLRKKIISKERMAWIGERIKWSAERTTHIVIVGLIALLTPLSALLPYLREKIGLQGKVSDVLEIMAGDGYMDIVELEGDGNRAHDLKVFSYACIMTATNSFSSETKLGEGGFGPVYKGKLPEGLEIAVKKLSRRSGQGLVEFKNELILIAKLQHMNLVRLLGCCIHGDDKMLIYEYMPNKSLDFFLFDPVKREQLTWERRFNIIEGIAQGLLYLHKYSRLRIVHRDLKASNILLDDHMTPKISDFGMAKIFEQNATEANTNRIVGTYGYMAPEYAMEGIFSVKSDVFSFGVLMLEIVTGRKNNSFYHVEGTLNLVGHAWEQWNKDAGLELMDPILSGSCIIHQLLRCIHVGLLCVEDNALDRPTMSDVISMLTNDTMALPMPKKPAFVTRSCAVEEDSQRTKLENYSVNGLSISAMNAR